jgi:hypothetical protein
LVQIIQVDHSLPHQLAPETEGGNQNGQQTLQSFKHSKSETKNQNKMFAWYYNGYKTILGTASSKEAPPK